MKKLLIVLGLLVLALFVVSCAPKEGGEEGALAGQATASRECEKLGKCGFLTESDLVKKFELDCTQSVSGVEEDFKETSGGEFCAVKGLDKGVAFFCINGFIIIENKNGADYFQPTSCSKTWNLDEIMNVWNEANSSNLGADDPAIAYTCCSIG